MSQRPTSTYDEVPYPSQAFPQAHPDRLATLATLFGMEPAPVERSRVLELGCGDGSHLIPAAFNFPESEFVGVDLAARPVAQGRALIDDLGLTNVRLHHAGIEDVTAEFGRFDYVVAHGVYSWVPDHVRDKMLAVCREHLTPHGVGYVSYNAKPGGHLRLMLREMMLFHVRGETEPARRIEHASALLKLVAESREEPDSYSLLFFNEVKRLSTYRPEHLFHDDLAEVNDAFYFHEFAARAARHSLQFLAEADYSEMGANSLPGPAVEALRKLAAEGGPDEEQYADFIRCRRFRQTLLCHAGVRLDRDVGPDRLARFYVAAPLTPASAAPDVRSRGVEQFRGVGSAGITTDSPLVKAAALLLGGRWPQCAHFTELLGAARALSGSGEGEEADAQRLGQVLLDAYGAGVIELRTSPLNMVTHVSDRPAASALALAQLRRGALVTSQRHLNVEIKDQLGRALFALLDGTRTRAALVEELSALVRSGRVDLTAVAPGLDAGQFLSGLPGGLDNSLSGLARSSLLVA